jgi:hypothetical protein
MKITTLGGFHQQDVTKPLRPKKKKKKRENKFSGAFF